MAEISCNFAYYKAGPWDRCVELIKQAANAKCDAVKLQTYKASTITMRSKKDPFLISGAQVDLWDGDSLYELYDKNALPVGMDRTADESCSRSWHGAIYITI